VYRYTAYIFPCALIICNIFAGVVSAVNGDFRRAIYWVAAAVLNAAVTF
jgi:hypothetical protein